MISILKSLRCIQKLKFRFAVFTPTSSFGTQQIDPQEFSSEFSSNENLSPKKMMEQEIKELSEIPEYADGVRLMIEKKFDQAEESLITSLKKLQEAENFKPRLISHVLKKICVSLKVQDKTEELTQYLEEAYFITFAEEKPNYPAMKANLTNLMLHYYYNDIQKGVALSETLIEQHNNQEIPLSQMKEIFFLIGTMYITAGNFELGAKYLEHCLDLKPNPVFRGMAYHNLAYAYWSNYNSFTSAKKKEMEGDIDKYIKGNDPTVAKTLQEQIAEASKNNIKVLPFFKKAIKSFEHLYGDDPIKYPRSESEKLSTKEFATIATVLDEQNHNFDIKKYPVEELKVKNQLSSLTALNIGEVFFQSGSLDHSLFWIKLSLEISTKAGMIPRNLRGMIILGLIYQEQSKFEFAEKLLIDCLEYMENMNLYNKVIALETYSNFLGSQKRIYEADDYFKQAQRLKLKIPIWYERLEALHIPDYNF